MNAGIIPGKSKIGLLNSKIHLACVTSWTRAVKHSVLELSAHQKLRLSSSKFWDCHIRAAIKRLEAENILYAANYGYPSLLLLLLKRRIGLLILTAANFVEFCLLCNSGLVSSFASLDCQGYAGEIPRPILDWTVITTKKIFDCCYNPLTAPPTAATKLAPATLTAATKTRIFSRPLLLQLGLFWMLVKP